MRAILKCLDWTIVIFKGLLILFFAPSKKYDWHIVGVAENKQPPDGTINLIIRIDISKKEFAFIVNGENYKFFRKNGEEIDLFKEFQKGLNVGWFNEVNPVELSSIKIG